MSDVAPLTELITQARQRWGSDGRPLSWSRLAERAGTGEDGQELISDETLRRLGNGLHRGEVTDRIVLGLSLALDRSRGEILSSLHGRQVAPPQPWRLPDRAHRLTTRQRKAVEAVIDAMLMPTGEEGGRADVIALAGRTRSEAPAKLVRPASAAARRRPVTSPEPGTQEQVDP